MRKYQQGRTFVFTHIYLAQYLKKNKTTIWLCIKNWCGMLVRAPEPNDKVEEVETVSTACVGEKRCAFPPLSVTSVYAGKQPGPWMKSIPNRDRATAEHMWPRICVMSRAQGVNKQIWLAWRRRVRGEIEIWCSYLERKQHGYTKRVRQWCGVSLLIRARDIQREPGGKTVISMPWFCKHNWCVAGKWLHLFISVGPV